MGSSTFVWDVSSGLVCGTILFALAIWMFMKLLKIGPTATSEQYVPLFFGSVLVGSIGVTMLAWSLVHLSEWWLLISW